MESQMPLPYPLPLSRLRIPSSTLFILPERQQQLTMFCFLALVSLFLGILPFTSQAQSSCTQLSPSGGIRPSIASGYQMQVVATGLSKPRGIKLDGAGNLLVVEQDRGVVSSHRINEGNGCVSLEDATDLTRDLGVSQYSHPK